MKNFLKCIMIAAVCLLGGCGNRNDKTIKIPDVTGSFEFTVLKAGQADAILMQTQNNSIIIDCGEKDDGDELVGLLREKDISNIDYLFITHFDKDHVGGFPEVMENITVTNIIVPDYEGNNDEYEEYLKYDRTIQYCYTAGVQVSVNDKTLSNYDASFRLIYELIGTLIAGDSDAYNELVHEDVGHFDSFTQQQVYDVVVTKYSETTKQSEAGKIYFEYVYVVEYKIHENNGTYRKDIESDACRAQYFVINNSTGELLIMDIFSKTHAN